MAEWCFCCVAGGRAAGDDAGGGHKCGEPNRGRHLRPAQRQAPRGWQGLARLPQPFAVSAISVVHCWECRARSMHTKEPVRLCALRRHSGAPLTTSLPLVIAITPRGSLFSLCVCAKVREPIGAERRDGGRAGGLHCAGGVGLPRARRVGRGHRSRQPQLSQAPRRRHGPCPKRRATPPPGRTCPTPEDIRSPERRLLDFTPSAGYGPVPFVLDFEGDK